MSWSLRNFSDFDIQNREVPVDAGQFGEYWTGLTIFRGKKAFFSNQKPSSWVIADVDSNGHIGSVRHLDLSYLLPSAQGGGYNYYETITFHNNKAIISSQWRTGWYVVDVDEDGVLSNPKNIHNLNLLLNSSDSGWGKITIFNNKAFFINRDRSKWMTADFDENLNFTNFQLLNLSSSLTTKEDGWIDMTVYDNKYIFFINIDRSKCMVATIDPLGRFINYQLADFTSYLKDTNLFGMTIFHNKAYFITGSHFSFRVASISNTDSWHYGDGAGGPHPTKNDWIGSFSGHTKQVEFGNIKDRVLAGEFSANEGGLTAISLPNALVIEDGAFYGSPLTAINLPKVYSIGNNAFYRTIDSSLTSVSIPNLFDNDYDKSRIFGANQWHRISFNWLHDTISANTIYWNGKIQDTQFEMDGKTVVKFIWNGKECVLKAAGGGTPVYGSEFSVSQQRGNGNPPYGITVTTTGTAPDHFTSDLVIDALPFPIGYSLSGSYTMKEINDWLADPNSVSGDVVADDWRIKHNPDGDGSAGMDARLAIDFTDVDGGRKITRVWLKPRAQGVDNFVSSYVKFTFTLNGAS